MPSHNKQFTLYNSHYGMNIWKICFVFEELGLTWNDIYLDFNKREQKDPEYMKLNPNGKIPTLIDHQRGDYVVWESNAIINYLVKWYDKEGKLTVPDDDGKTEIETWMYFQASGQAPYFGQAQWFMLYHHEKLPSAIERYQNEIKRVLGVLDNVLSTREWLVGGKMTLADLSFLKYNDYATTQLLGDDFDFEKEFPHAARWHQKMLDRPAVRCVYKYKEELRKRDKPKPIVW